MEVSGVHNQCAKVWMLIYRWQPCLKEANLTKIGGEMFLRERYTGRQGGSKGKNKSLYYIQECHTSQHSLLACSVSGHTCRDECRRAGSGKFSTSSHMDVCLKPSGISVEYMKKCKKDVIIQHTYKDTSIIGPL